MNSWSTITSIAMLGTSRTPVPADTLWPDAQIAVSGDKPERTLLRIVAANHLWRVAGTRAAEEPSDPGEPAPASDEKYVGEVALWRLGRILTGTYRQLVPEWFALARKAGKVLPPHWLPVVFEELDRDERAAAGGALSKQAAWLAARNPEWNFTAEVVEPSEERWINGTLDERRAELVAMRRVDPARAREWIQRTWAEDPAEAREAFLKTLIDSLHADDEPLLETALDDKRKGVRLMAAECLSRLPSSAHARRTLERLAPLIQLEAKGTGLLARLRKQKLNLELPAEPDKAAIRDGIETKPPANRKIGERAYWLKQMVSMVRPMQWCERFNCDPETFISAAMATDYADNLLEALTSATVRHPDLAWIAILCERWLASTAPTESGESADTSIPALILATPPAERAGIVKLVFERIKSDRFGLAESLLVSGAIEWTPAVTERAFKLLATQMNSDVQAWSHHRDRLTAWAFAADLGVAQRELAALQARCLPDSPWTNALNSMLDILDFRAAMTKELLT